MKYSVNGKLEDDKSVCINKISKNNDEKMKKIYRIKCNGKYRNIIEEENTIYEVDSECLSRYNEIRVD